MSAFTIVVSSILVAISVVFSICSLAVMAGRALRQEEEQNTPEGGQDDALRF